MAEPVHKVVRNPTEIQRCEGAMLNFRRFR
jgi:hypothetical protein